MRVVESETLPAADRVGLLGYGVMGRAIADRLRETGTGVGVYARSDAEARVVSSAGGTPLIDIQQLCSWSSYVIVSLPSAEAMRQVLRDSAWSERRRQGVMVIDTSTVHPDDSRQFQRLLQSLGHDYIDAPVSGGPDGASGGTLSIMMGGREASCSEAQKVLRPLGSHVVRVGDVGAGQVAKACNQLVVGGMIEAVAEALGLGERSGIEPGLLRDVLAHGSAGGQVLERQGRRMVARNFEDGGKIRVHAKDAAIFCDLAKRLGVSVPAGRVVREALQTALDRGLGALDHSALVLGVVGSASDGGMFDGARCPDDIEQ